MNETLPQIDVESQFNAMMAASFGGVAVMSQIERPMPNLPAVTPAEASGFAAHLEQRPDNLIPLTEEEINKFTAQLENDELEGADKAFFEENDLTAAEASVAALRAEEANRVKAKAVFGGIQEQAGIGDRLRALQNNEEEDDEEEENPRTRYTLAG